jgi:HK97 family phage major capsid protein
MPLADQLKSLERDRDTLLDSIEALVTGAENESRGFTDDETKKHTELKAQLETVVHRRDTVHEALELQKLRAARTIAANDGGAPPADGGRILDIRVEGPKLPPGIKFSRYVQAIGASKGNLIQALEIAKRWRESSPEVEAIMRAAVAVGTTTDATWASALVPYKVMADEFINLLYPQTIIGQLPLRKVPFNVRIPRMTAGATAQWVGEGKAKPVQKGAFDTISVLYHKLAVIAVMTDELMRFSNPSAEMLVRDMLLQSIAKEMNAQFIDPARAAVAGVKPASITNGVTPSGPLAFTAAAIRSGMAAMIGTMLGANYTMDSLRWVTNPVLTVNMGAMRTAQDVPAFPELQQGKLSGIPVVVSNNVPIVAGTPNTSDLILVAADSILLADDGQVTVDVSREASVEMSDAPETDTGTVVSLWQTNTVGILTERYITWTKARADAVAIATVNMS